jgi:ABC-2 type transport system permease protein
MTIEKEMIINAVNKFAENSNINIEASKYLDEINSKGPAVSVITLQQNKKIPEKLVMVTSCFTLISIFIALVLSSSFFSEKRSNILKRMLSMDMNKKEIFLGNFLSSFVITLLIISSYYIIAYYLIFRVKISLISLIIVILINSFFISAVAAFIIGIFKSEKTVKLIFMPFVMVLTFFGGSFFPVDSYKGAAALAVFTPNYNLMKLYEGVLQGSYIGELTGDIFKILIPALILTIIGAVVFCLREE